MILVVGVEELLDSPRRGEKVMVQIVLVITKIAEVLSFASREMFPARKRCMSRAESVSSVHGFPLNCGDRLAIRAGNQRVTDKLEQETPH